MALVDDPVRTAALRGTFPVLGIALVAELLWAISYTVWPRKAVLSSAARP
jgi:hypothetical protein